MNVVFSIIIPTYNGEKTIGLLLEKLQNLVGNYSKEIIIIDSGSSDKTIQITEKFQKIIPCLKLIKIKREGFNHGETRNFGVRMSQGKYVCFFSQDAIPKNKHFLEYYFKDFKLDKKVVAVYGKHIPYKNTPLIQKLEVICRWEKLDKNTNRQGILIQELANPFIPFSEENKVLWYSLSNVTSCYRKSFLLNHPFQKIDYGEDLLMGRTIIENGFIKIYDARCQVTHSHKLNLLEYYKKQREDFALRFSRLNLKEKGNFWCKIKKLLLMRESPIKKIYFLLQLFLYYVIKFFVLIEIKFLRLVYGIT